MTRSLPLCLALTCLAFSQPQSPEFETASVKVSPPPANKLNTCRGGPGSDDPARMTCGPTHLDNLIAWAYDVKYFQVKGPDWLTQSRFDIAAIVPAGASREQLPAMWRKLLADRFHLAVHREDRETTVYDLVVAKSGPKLKLAAQPGALDSGPRPAVPLILHMSTLKGTMDGLATFLAGELQTTVRNTTGLKDEYAFRLGWNPGTAAADSGPTLEEAIEEQLGLRLEPKKGPMSLIIVDHIDRTPTEN